MGTGYADTGLSLENRPFYQDKLDNGLQIVLLPSHNLPIVTHSIWYRVGAADEPAGQSGIAHFLEHLMFRGTSNIADGDFSQIVSNLGGHGNAFTSHDHTGYYQNVPAAALKTMMQLESDRMQNLVLDAELVAIEKQVVLEERANRIDNNPQALLQEQILASLYRNHPYGRPIIGWRHEIKDLKVSQLRTFYNRYYCPGNAIVIVAGDVKFPQLMQFARATYGQIPSCNHVVDRRIRPMEPLQDSHRRVIYSNKQVQQPIFYRYYMVPSYSHSRMRHPAALDLGVSILGDNFTGLLYKRLVEQNKVASYANADYYSSGYDYGELVISVIPLPHITMQDIEDSVNKVIDDFLVLPFEQVDLKTARKSLQVESAFYLDDLQSKADTYGRYLVNGLLPEQVHNWPRILDTITEKEIKMAMKEAIEDRDGVSGWLLPKDKSTL